MPERNIKAAMVVSCRRPMLYTGYRVIYGDNAYSCSSCGTGPLIYQDVCDEYVVSGGFKYGTGFYCGTGEKGTAVNS